MSVAINHWLRFAFILLSVLVTTPCRAAERNLIEGAKREGQLSWYTGMAADQNTRIVDAFQNKYPFMKVNVWRANTALLLEKILLEARANKFPDVVVISDFEMGILLNQSLLAPYRSQYRDAIPEGFKDREGYWTNFYDNITTIAFNTNAVSPNEAPKSYQDLLHPRWKGRKLGLDNTDFAWVANFLNIVGKDKGAEFMKRLNMQELDFRNGHTHLSQLVQIGEIPVCVTCYNYRIEEMKAKGAPVEWVPAEPTIGEQHPIAIFAKSKQPNAARLFVDFALSTDGQEIIQKIGRIPARRDVSPSPSRLTQGLKIYPSDLSLASKKKEIIKQFQELFPGSASR